MTATIGVLLLIAVATGGRWHSSRRLWSEESATAGRLSLDEVVYIVLGDNLVQGRGYSAAGIHRRLGVDSERVPSYLQDSLFKHPPLFPLLVGVSRATFHGQPWAAFLPSLLLSAVSMVALYWLMVELATPLAARWIAVTLLATSPIHWISSSRVWMEVAVCAFVLLAIAAQARAERRMRGFWQAGLFWGCAFLTKYTAFVAWAAWLATTLVRDRGTRVSAAFWRGQCLSLGLVAPWFFMRFEHEGLNVLWIWSSGVQEWRLLSAMFLDIRWMLAMIVAVGVLGWGHVVNTTLDGRPVHALFGATTALVVLLALPNSGVGLLDQPWAGWHDNALANYGPSFYLTYRSSLEPACLLAFAASLPLSGTSRNLVLQGTWVSLLLFLSAWGNYQSRYALPLVPLEALFVGTLCARVCESPQGRAGRAVAGLAVGWLAFSIFRSSRVVWQLGTTNDFFYF